VYFGDHTLSLSTAAGATRDSLDEYSHCLPPSATPLTALGGKRRE